MLTAIGEANLIQLFAWYAAFVLLRAASPSLATARDMAAALSLAAAMFAANLSGSHVMFAAVATAGAAYLFEIGRAHV